MKRKSVFFLWLVSAALVIIPSFVFGSTWETMGSAYTPAKKPHSITYSSHGIPVVNESVNMDVDYLSSLCSPEVVGTYKAVSSINIATAKIVERKYTCSGSVAGPSSATGTISMSNVDYTVASILNGPGSCDLTDVTFGKSEWECEIPVGTKYKGTTYYYYRAKTDGTGFSGGRCDGDIKGEFHFTNASSSTSLVMAILATEIKGVRINSDDNTFTITVSSSTLVASASTYDNVGVGWRTMSISSVYSGSCLADPQTIIRNCASFSVPKFYCGVTLGQWYPESDPAQIGKFSSYTSLVSATVPDVAGMTKDNATKALFSAGLNLGDVTQVNDSAPAGQVLSQTVAAGTEAAPGTVVGLTVSLGPAGNTTKYTLSASVSGGHGKVFPDNGTYAKGEKVTLTTEPDSGWQVKSWQGTDDDTSKSGTNTVTMDGNKTVMVEFEQISNQQDASGEEDDSGSDDDDDEGGGGSGGCFIRTVASPMENMPVLFIILIAAALMSGSRIRNRVGAGPGRAVPREKE